MDEQDIYRLVESLSGSPDETQERPDVRAGKLQTLIDLGEAAVGPLIEGLASPHRAYLSRALTAIGTPSIKPLGQVLMRDDDPIRRANAAFTLGRMRATAGVAALIAALGDSEADVRREAATALINFRDERAVLPLCDALGDPEPEVRSAVAQALGVQDDVRGVEPLNDVYLRDADVRVRKAAQQSLEHLGYAPSQLHINVRPELGIKMARQLSPKTSTDNIKADSLGIPRVELLLATLESPDDIVQRRAAHELVNMGQKALVPLMAALDRDHRDVRAYAAWALGEIGDLQALDALQGAMIHDPDEEVRYAAEQALMKLEESQ